MKSYQSMKKEADIDDDCSSNHMTIVKPKLFYLLFLSLISCSFILAAHLFTSSPTFSLLYSIRFEDDEKLASEADENASSGNTVFNGTISCDRRFVRSDICNMTGDVRTDPLSSSIIVYGTKFNGSGSGDGDGVIQREKIRPYTRKLFNSIMVTIDELELVVKVRNSAVNHRCDVRHDSPGLFFSTGGYTGNLFHEFADSIVPLYMTSRRYNGKVVFVILEYHHWWFTFYDEILAHLSDYDVIDFRRDKRTHCFPGAVVGLRAHDDLQIEPAWTDDNTTIRDFQDFLDRAYAPRIKEILSHEPKHFEPEKESKKPKLVIMARNDSRKILNQGDLIKMAQEIGFRVSVLKPNRPTGLARMYKVLNSTDALVGVHGAALTHFLFLRPGSAFIQIVPIGIDWAAETYFEQPAIKMGMKYIGYYIFANESTLIDEYDEKDPVFTDTLSVNRKGWNYTQQIYLDPQNVRLNLGRFRAPLMRAYYYAVRKLNGSSNVDS
nr:EGF domain-specific O-linked N-acetylglucosamine transferase-like [Ipomoea batatas]